jgi:hypothetical protein
VAAAHLVHPAHPVATAVVVALHAAGVVAAHPVAAAVAADLMVVAAADTTRTNGLQ